MTEQISDRKTAAQDLPTMSEIAQLIAPTQARYTFERRRFKVLAIGSIWTMIVLDFFAWKLPDLKAVYLDLGLCFLVFGVVSWLVARRRPPDIESLIRSGAVYPARFGGLPKIGSFVRVHWEVSGRAYSTLVRAFDFDPPVNQVAVIADQRRVAVLLNGKLYRTTAGS